MPHPPLSFSPVKTIRRFGAPVGQRLAYALALGLLCYVAVLLAGGAEMATRAKLLRYWTLFGAGVLAVAMPHVLLPDPRRPLMQLLNRPAPQLLADQLRRWVAVVSVMAVPAAVLAFYDPDGFAQALALKGALLAESVLVLAGVGGYSFDHYATLGRRSQRWQEGHLPAWYRAMKEQSTTGGFGVPDGLAPAVLAAGRVFLLALAAVILGAYAGRAAGPVAAWAPGLALCTWAGARLLAQRAGYDRHFYQTSALYDEVFRQGGGVRGEARAPVAYEAVYWAPRRWRPAVWASLLQMDRRLPLGRLVAVGHAVLWLLFLQNAAESVIAAYLLLFVAATNAACVVLARPALAPPGFQLAQQSAGAWVATRFFVNLRWTLPLLLSLLLVAFFDDGFAYAEAFLWTGLDVLLALLAAAAATYRAEYAYFVGNR